MSDQVVRPQDVLAGGLRDDLVDAMKYAYMRKGAFDGGEMRGVEWRDGENSVGGSSWKYRIDLGILVNDPEITCDSSGSWRHEQFIGGDDALSPGSNFIDANDNSYEVVLPDVSAKFAEIEQFVDDWVQPWVDGSPDPTAFTNQINSIATVAKQLFVGAGPSEGSGGSAPTSADLDLWDAMTEVDISVDNTSLAVDKFQRHYSSDIWKTIGGQQCLVYGAGLAVAAEASAWNEAYKTLRSFLEVARSDFLSYAGSSEGGGEGLDAALGATSTVVGVLGAGVGVALPPFGAAMGLVAGFASVAQLMTPSTPAVPDESVALKGGDFEAKLDSFKEQVKAINEDLAEAEEIVGQGCRNLIRDLRQKPDNYSLTRNPRKQGDNEDFDELLTGTIDVIPAKLRSAAGACELIARHQRGLAGILSGNDAQGNPSATVGNEYTRNSLPETGVIGSGSTGPLADITHLVGEAVDLLLDEGKESHRVAEWLIGLAQDFQDTDAGEAARARVLDRLVGDIDDYELSRGNDPSDPNSIS